MKTRPQTAPNERPQKADNFIVFPVHQVLSVFETAEEADEAVTDLKENGFASEDIRSFCGMRGEKAIDFEGKRHGTLTSLIRAVQHIGPERTYLERYEKELHAGHCVVMVRVASKRKKERAAHILHSHTKQRVTYFGRFMAEEIPG